MTMCTPDGPSKPQTSEGLYGLAAVRDLLWQQNGGASNSDLITSTVHNTMTKAITTRADQLAAQEQAAAQAQAQAQQNPQAPQTPKKPQAGASAGPGPSASAGSTMLTGGNVGAEQFGKNVLLGL